MLWLNKIWHFDVYDSCLVHHLLSDNCQNKCQKTKNMSSHEYCMKTVWYTDWIKFVSFDVTDRYHVMPNHHFFFKRRFGTPLATFVNEKSELSIDRRRGSISLKPDLIEHVTRPISWLEAYYVNHLLRKRSDLSTHIPANYSVLPSNRQHRNRSLQKWYRVKNANWNSITQDFGQKRLLGGSKKINLIWKPLMAFSHPARQSRFVTVLPRKWRTPTNDRLKIVGMTMRFLIWFIKLYFTKPPCPTDWV